MEYWLSQKGFRPNDELIRGCRGDRVSGLWVASQKGYTDGVKLLIKAGADVNQPRNDGVAPLYIAAQDGRAEVVQILVNTEGVALNQPMNDGATPLYIAAQNGHSEVVKILLQAGADQSIKWRFMWCFTRSPRAAAKIARPCQFVDPDEWQKYTVNTLTEYRQTYKRKRSRPVITAKDNEETPLLSEFPKLRLQSGSK